MREALFLSPLHAIIGGSEASVSLVRMRVAAVRDNVDRSGQVNLEGVEGTSAHAEVFVVS